jgi:hypothetical protein
MVSSARRAHTHISSLCLRARAKSTPGMSTKGLRQKMRCASGAKKMGLNSWRSWQQPALPGFHPCATLVALPSPHFHIHPAMTTTSSRSLLTLAVLAGTLALTPPSAEARRVGGGRSIGMSRSHVTSPSPAPSAHENNYSAPATRYGEPDESRDPRGWLGHPNQRRNRQSPQTDGEYRRPSGILWHIMKIYSSHGIHDFVICCGYMGYVIKEYFANYFLHMSDVTFDMTHNSMEIHERHAEPWRVTLVDTGENTQTGGRLARVRQVPAGRGGLLLHLWRRRGRHRHRRGNRLPQATANWPRSRPCSHPAASAHWN